MAGRSRRAILTAALLTALSGTFGGLAACAAPSAGPSATPSGPASPSSPASPSTAPTPGASSVAPSPSPPVTKPSTQEPKADQVVIDITIADGKVQPNGRKIDVPLGYTVVLNVTSDIDDEIHAHLGADDFTLDVRAGKPERGRFSAAAKGSFEVESHETGKIIVILNVR